MLTASFASMTSKCFARNFFIKSNFFRHLSKSSLQPKYFVSSPIYYVNGDPHIGHLQSCLYADAFARMHKLLEKKVVFSTGTDEHGLKVQLAAEAVGKKTSLYCDEMSKRFEEVFKLSDISFTHFIRTTEDVHLQSVRDFWERLNKNGFIHKGKYSGWYSVVEEVFVPSSNVKEVKEGTKSIMVSSETGSPLLKMEEENYIFHLSKFQEDILKWLSKDVVKPSLFIDDLRRWIDNGLSDISISRPASRLSWGIPVPGDPSQTIYVWLDALVNYLTVGINQNKDPFWPIDCHVIGKDILKFHGIYWPAFLMAAGYDPPKMIFCHSHWTVNYEKMSKSKGNVVDPKKLINEYDCDGFRYFLLRASVPHSDTNYSEVKIQRLLNAELADTFGNLLSRCCAPALNPKQVFPAFSLETFDVFRDEQAEKLIESACALPDRVQELFLDGLFNRGLDAIMDCLRDTNAFLQSQEPWNLVKREDENSQKHLNTVLHITFEVLRISSLLLQPIVPTLADAILTQLGVSANERGWKDFNCFAAYHQLGCNNDCQPLNGVNKPLYVRRKRIVDVNL